MQYKRAPYVPGNRFIFKQWLHIQFKSKSYIREVQIRALKRTFLICRLLVYRTLPNFLLDFLPGCA